MPNAPDDRKVSTPLRFRPLAVADDLALIAERETEGNVSEAIRLSIRNEAQRIRRRDRRQAA